MNIFFTSECPVDCAVYLDTRRCNKMILESAQMLCTALYDHASEHYSVGAYSIYPKKLHKKTGKPIQKLAYYLKGIRMYAPTHKNHPSNVWARETRANYLWLLAHFKALAVVYRDRREKWHKSFVTLYDVLSEGAEYIPEGDLTPLANCAANDSKGVSFKHIEDTCEAYRLYLTERWKSDIIKPVWV